MKSIFLIFLMAIFGSLATISFSLQFVEESLGKLYAHVFVQQMHTSLGQFLCLIFYGGWVFFDSLFAKDKESCQTKDGIDVISRKDNSCNELVSRDEVAKDKNPSFKVYFVFLLTSTFDVIAGVLYGYALIHMPTSVYQMLKGGLVVMTALFTTVFLGRIHYRHHIVGILLVVLSLFILGIGGVKNIEQHSSRRANFLEEGIVILAITCTAIQYTIQEKVLMHYDIPPLKMVGIEGLWGLLIYSSLLPLFISFRCDEYPWREFICTENNHKEWRIEDNLFALKQMFSNNLLFFLIITALCCVSVYYLLGVTITKENSASNRAISDNLKALFVWLFFIFVPTKIEEQFFFSQFVGFVIMVFGTLIFNEVIEVSIFNLNFYTEKSIKRRSECKLTIEQDEEKESLNQKTKTISESDKEPFTEPESRNQHKQITLVK